MHRASLAPVQKCCGGIMPEAANPSASSGVSAQGVCVTNELPVKRESILYSTGHCKTGRELGFALFGDARANSSLNTRNLIILGLSKNEVR